VAPDLRLPADLATRQVPAQNATVDGAKLLAAAQMPKRKDRVWHIELAPLTRMQAWHVDEIKPGAPVGVLGFAFPGEQRDPVLRAEYLFVAGKVYGMWYAFVAGLRRLRQATTFGVLSASRAAARVAAISSVLCAALTKPASYKAGAK
jgi:hypothetical protein